MNSTLPGFITHDNAASTNRKTRYILKQRGFGGVFMWELSADYDGHSQDLLNALYKVWQTAQWGRQGVAEFCSALQRCGATQESRSFASLGMTIQN